MPFYSLHETLITEISIIYKYLLIECIFYPTPDFVKCLMTIDDKRYYFIYFEQCLYLDLKFRLLKISTEVTDWQRLLWAQFYNSPSDLFRKKYAFNFVRLIPCLYLYGILCHKKSKFCGEKIEEVISSNRTLTFLSAR